MSSEYFELLRMKNNSLAEHTRKRLLEVRDSPSPSTEISLGARQLTTINMLITDHLAEMTEWEVSFCYSNKHFLVNNPTACLSKRSAEKLAELVEMYE
jgi:hypothetical protein